MSYLAPLGYVPISCSAPRPLGAAYIPILLSEVEQEQRPSGNGDREAIVVGTGLCDGEGEGAYTGYAPTLEQGRSKSTALRLCTYKYLIALLPIDCD